jgi:chromosome segregation ATPase
MNENPGANSKIIRLTSENVKRIQVVEITPTGNVVVVAGKNGEGKTSVLDSIMYALGGAGTFAKQPVRQGAQKATIEIELDDLTVKRTITANGNTSLSVTKKDGSKYSTPQSILDGLVGKLSFDPLDFSRQKPEAQGETLRQIAGLDFEQHNQEVDSIFASRTFVNREVKNLEARLAAMPAARPNLPEEEQSTADVLTRQQAATTTNSENQKRRDTLEELKRATGSIRQEQKINEEQIVELQDEIAKLQAKLTAREKARDTIGKRLLESEGKEEALTAEVATLQDVPLDGFAEELSKLEETNRQVRAAAERRRVQAELKEKREKSDSFTKQISKLEELKAKKIREAKYPIEGLSVNLAGDVLFNDLPLEQASSAQQLRVSVAIGLALNPKLRVLLVRDGSLLDETSRALLLELAMEHDAQVWLEQVGTDGDVSVIIEDGMVKETTE